MHPRGASRGCQGPLVFSCDRSQVQLCLWHLTVNQALWAADTSDQAHGPHHAKPRWHNKTCSQVDLALGTQQADARTNTRGVEVVSGKPLILLLYNSDTFQTYGGGDIQCTPDPRRQGATGSADFHASESSPFRIVHGGRRPIGGFFSLHYSYSLQPSLLGGALLWWLTTLVCASKASLYKHIGGRVWAAGCMKSHTFK